MIARIRLMLEATLVLLVLSMSLVAKAGTANVSVPMSAESIVRFEPQYIKVSKGQTFTITAMIENTENLYGFDLQTAWNTTYMRYLNYIVTVPVNSYPGGLLYAPVIPVMEMVDENDSLGTAPGTMFWLAIASMRPAPSFSGNGSAFRMTFKALNQTGTTTLNFTSINLGDYNGYPIPYVHFNCTIVIGDTTPPTIKGVEWKGLAPYPYAPSDLIRVNEPILVTANITDPANETGVAGAQLSYRVDGSEWWNTSMGYNATSGLWATVIPRQAGSTAVEFFMRASDNAGNTATSSVYAFNVEALITGDQNGDGKVDIFDVVLCTGHYGQHNP